MLIKKLLIPILLLSVFFSFSQEKKKKASSTYIGVSDRMKPVGSLQGKKLIPEPKKPKQGAPKLRVKNNVIPGKGLPKGEDPLLYRQKNSFQTKTLAPPILTFEANSNEVPPTDPTGAVGPNHFVSAKNSAFAIHDKSGNLLQESISLANIFEGESDGDPIVFYDNFADRFVITQFFGAFQTGGPYGFLVAVCRGPNPVTDGWYTYRFETDTFPDYPKFSVWSDGYYVTCNKNQNNPSGNEVVFVLERDKMLEGNETARIQGFPLPGALTNQFYCPLSFNAIGDILPPKGSGHIVYFQDDSWNGVNEDMLKLWSINLDWDAPRNSFITEDQDLTVSNGDISVFDATFDGAGIGNLPQPDGGELKDALQGAIMQASNYRRFCDYNSVVFNFAVDIDSRTLNNSNDSDRIAGIRWYELRQDGDNAPWYVNQEGTYTAPGGKSAWCASMAMDVYGNIGMGYSSVGTVENGANRDSFISLHYTGRTADDPPGLMTFAEQTIKNGTGVSVVSGNPNRYGDYSHLTVDPVDQSTFWFISEYPEAEGPNMRDYVGVFKIAENTGSDVGVIAIDSPRTGTLSTETVTVKVKNFGSSAISNFPVQYNVNGGPGITETFTGILQPGEVTSFTFQEQIDLSLGEEFTIESQTNFSSDETPINDCGSITIQNLPPNDIGVTQIINPSSGGGLNAQEPITVNIKNFGGEDQSNFNVYYVLDDGSRVTETFDRVLASQTSQSFTFNQTADFSEFMSFVIESGTELEADSNLENDIIIEEIIHEQCNPTSDCAGSSDGIIAFQLANVTNRDIPCNDGYENFQDLTIELDKAIGTYVLTVQTGYVQEDAQRFSVWIDFNDDNVFENEEIVLDNQVIKEDFEDQNYAFKIAPNAPVGRHRFRIRGGDTANTDGGGNKLNDPCASMKFGTTHDYFVEIGENINTTSDIIVASEGDNQFFITMSDSDADEVLRLSVYDLTGKLIVTNLVDKNAGSTFRYDLDMSYVQPGVYFVQMGSNTTGRSTKFIVK